MKTILVVYTENLITSKSKLAGLKHYAFNTDSDIEANTLVESSNYQTPMQIFKVLDKAFKYFNLSTGELSNEYTSTAQREIREMIITEPCDENVVVATKLETF